MRFLVALSTVAMIGLSSSAMGFEATSSAAPAINLNQTIQSLEVRTSGKLAGDDLILARGGRGGGFFGRVMEIERRKNAWLRGMFR